MKNLFFMGKQSEKQGEKRYSCIRDRVTKDLGLRGSELPICAVIHGFTETCAAC